MPSYDEKVLQVIPSTFNMISSSADNQRSEEAQNTNKFELPNPAGKAGGACTSALLQVLYESGRSMSWVEVLKEMRRALKGMGYDQIPQLTSSRLIDVNESMSIVPPGSGRRRALLIGINYVGQEGALTACHNDVRNVKEFLVQAHGFKEDEMLILMDDGAHHPPTRKNIEEGFIRITKYSQPGDVVFVSFSGHGGNVEDKDGDEDDGFDETLIPLDFKEAGHIVDDDILKMLVKPMRTGVHCTVLMDCCHSGTVLDLPYKFGADDARMQREKGFNLEKVDNAERSSKKADQKKADKKKAERQNKDRTEKKKQDHKKKKEKDDKKKQTEDAKQNDRNESENSEAQEQYLGPKLDEYGNVAPLPIRQADPNHNPPPPPPPGCCSIL